MSADTAASSSPSPTTSSPGSPQLRFSPFRTPLLESSLVPSSLDSPPSRHTHIHIHSHSHFPHPHPTLDPQSSPSSWVLAPAPTKPTTPYPTPSFSPSCHRRCRSALSPSSSPSSSRCCKLPASVQFFLLLSLLAAFLLYQTHLCTIAKSHPDSPLSFLHSLHRSFSPPSTSPPSPLLSLTALSSPSHHLSSYNPAPPRDALPDVWQQRLAPVQVELESGYAWLTVNLVLFSGLAHSPPLYDGLPCLHRLPLLPPTPCHPAPLDLSPQQQYSVTIIPLLQRLSAGEERDALYPPSGPEWAPQAESGEWRWLSASQASALSPLPSTRLSTNSSHPLTLLSAVESLAAVALSVVARVRVTGLEEGRVYRFQVSVGNATHRTAPLTSLPVLAQPQLALYKAEQQRTTRYLNLITDPASPPPPPLSPPLPFRVPVLRAAHRQAAPYERVAEVCPAAFLAWVDDYRAFHAQQVRRLRGAKGDPAALAALVRGEDGVRLIVSGVYRWSGVTDRTSALVGVYMMALLTGRVLLLDQDWPDIQRVMLSPLTLGVEEVVGSGLRHPLLANYTQEVEVTDVGPVTDGYEREYTGPIVLITSIKGVLMRLLTESRDYSARLQGMGLRPETVVGCVAHSFWTVRLSALVAHPGYEPVMRRLLTSPTPSIAIQVRSWHDYVFLSLAKAKKAATYTPPSTPPTVAGMAEDPSRAVTALQAFGTQGFFHCAQDWTDSLRLSLPADAAGQEVVWYLVSDDEEVRAAAVARWGGGVGGVRVVSLMAGVWVGHSNAVDVEAGFLYLRHAVVEQWLFALCEWAVVSQASGYGRWPALLGLRGRRVFMLNNDQQNVTRKAAKTCMDEEKDAVSILDLSREWSKV